MGALRFGCATVLCFSVISGLATASRAQPVNRNIDCDSIPSNWQAAISFYKSDQDGGSGVYFFEVSKDDNKGITRIEKMHVAYDVKNSKVCFHEEHEINIGELYSPYVIKFDSGRRVVTLKTNDANDQGGTIQMTVLKEANAVFSDDYSSPMYFSVGIADGKVTASRRGKPFNVMRITQLWKKFPIKGKIPAGIKRIEFLNHNSSINDDFVP